MKMRCTSLVFIGSLQTFIEPSFNVNIIEFELRAQRLIGPQGHEAMSQVDLVGQTPIL